MISNPMVFNVCVFHITAFGKMKLFALLFLQPKFSILTFKTDDSTEKAIILYYSKLIILIII